MQILGWEQKHSNTQNGNACKLRRLLKRRRGFWSYQNTKIIMALEYCKLRNLPPQIYLKKKKPTGLPLSFKAGVTHKFSPSLTPQCMANGHVLKVQSGSDLLWQSGGMHPLKILTTWTSLVMHFPALWSKVKKTISIYFQLLHVWCSFKITVLGAYTR